MNKNRRISAKDALNHPWFAKNNTKAYFCQVTDRRPVDFQCLADWDILFS